METEVRLAKLIDKIEGDPYIDNYKEEHFLIRYLKGENLNESELMSVTGIINRLNCDIFDTYSKFWEKEGVSQNVIDQNNPRKGNMKYNFYFLRDVCPYLKPLQKGFY